MSAAPRLPTAQFSLEAIVTPDKTFASSPVISEMLAAPRLPTA
jgi:hypothetical protein